MFKMKATQKQTTIFRCSAALLMTGVLTLNLSATVLAADQASLSHLGSYSTGYSDQEGGVAEIVAYNSDNQKFYLVNGREQRLDIVSLSGLTADGSGQPLSLEKRVDVSNMIPGFSFGDITSVAVDTVNDRIAVAVQAKDYAADGAILLLNYDGSYAAHYQAGVQPDMVTFSPDGSFLLSANEGEPRKGYGEGITDPQGSVTVVSLADKKASTVTFEAWDDRRSELVSNHVILKKGLSPSTDFEPEYIAVSADSKTAYVALQEANAIAVLDIAADAFTAVNSLGFKNHQTAGNELDSVKDGRISIDNANLFGVYMPDGISVYQTGAKTYLLTANEGDASEWGEGEAEYTNLKVTAHGGEELEVLDESKLDGLPEIGEGSSYLPGGRSFSIYEVTGNSLTQIYDSGSEFERLTAKVYPDNFNASNKNNKLDSRSDAKGPEPESVTVAAVGGRTYAYIGLERISGIMLYDITNPTKPSFVTYVNSRDFSVDFPKEGTSPLQGDISVEGLCTVPAVSSPTGFPLVLAANEVSGTVAVYQQK